VQNESEQYEARTIMVEVEPNTKSIFFDGMQGSRIPIVVAHGEGRIQMTSQPLDPSLVALRYIHPATSKPTNQFPYNPNGSPEGITGITASSGRVLAMMPHPERVVRPVSMSWCPAGKIQAWGDSGPWLRMFINARKWIG